MSDDKTVHLLAEQLKATQLQTQLLQHIAEYVKGKGSTMSQTIPETNASTLKAALMELLAHSMRDFFYEPECELFSKRGKLGSKFSRGSRQSRPSVEKNVLPYYFIFIEEK